MEQRRSQRRACRLVVEVTDGQTRFTGHTKDVSRHGFFLLTPADLKERFLVQLVLHLPSGPLHATGFVVHTANTKGAGVQFFALSAAAKTNWDHFVGGAAPQPQPDPQAHPERAVFLLKLRDRARLEEFAERNLLKGGLYLATPVIKEEGAPITLVVVHPDSEDEFHIEGEVARVCREPPKGMDVRFSPPDPVYMAAFRTFIETGEAPHWDEVPPTPEAPPQAPAAPEPPKEASPEPSGDLSIEIDLDSTALDESTRFSWDDVSDYRMVLDFQLTSRGASERDGGLSSDGAVTVERLAPPELAALARPTGDLPTPSFQRAGVSVDLPVIPGPAVPDAPPSARNRWTWSSPPQGVPPVVPPPTEYDSAPPSRFPPARAPTQPPYADRATSVTPPPEVLDLGLLDTGDVLDPPHDDAQIPILDPVTVDALDETFDIRREQAPAGVFDSNSPEAQAAADEVAALLEAELSDRPGIADRHEAAEAVEEALAAEAVEEALAAKALEEALAAREAERDEPDEAAEPLAPPKAAPAPVAWPDVLQAAGSPVLSVHLSCQACGADFGAVEIGRADGALGLVAEHKPYWNPELQKMVSVLRMRAAGDRSRVAEALVEASDQVPVGLLFEVADLGRPPADPQTGTRVRVNSLVKALLKAQPDLVPGQEVLLPRALCPKCKEPRIQVQSQAEPT